MFEFSPDDLEKASRVLANLGVRGKYRAGHSEAGPVLSYLGTSLRLLAEHPDLEDARALAAVYEAWNQLPSEAPDLGLDYSRGEPDQVTGEPVPPGVDGTPMGGRDA